MPGRSRLQVAKIAAPDSRLKASSAGAMLADAASLRSQEVRGVSVSAAASLAPRSYSSINPCSFAANFRSPAPSTRRWKKPARSCSCLTRDGLISFRLVRLTLPAPALRLFDRPTHRHTKVQSRARASGKTCQSPRYNLSAIMAAEAARSRLAWRSPCVNRCCKPGRRLWMSDAR